MQKIKILLIFSLGICLSIFGETSNPPIPTTAQSASPHASAMHDPEYGSIIYVGPIWNYVTSKWGNGKKQQGSLGGVVGGYFYIAPNAVFFNAEFDYTSGILKGSAGNDPTQEYVTELKLGYSFSLAQNKLLVTPFVGGGSYIIHQSLSHHLDFNSYFWYTPIGLAGTYHLNSHWTIGLIGFGAPTFGGRWKEHHSDKASTKPLWKVEFPLIYLGSLPFELAIIPFATGWGFHKSGDLVAQNNTYYGMRLAFAYHF